MLYLADTFSIDMLPDEYCTYEFRPLSISRTAAILYVLHDEVVNIIGNPDTAAVVESVLRAEVGKLELPEPQQLTVRLFPADEVLVAQHTGPQPLNGTAQPLDGARLRFWLVTRYDSARKEMVWKALSLCESSTPVARLELLRVCSRSFLMRAVEVHEVLVHLD
jgi:hypothetical protein